MNLEESWIKTTRFLEAAFALLPANPKPNLEGGSVEAFRDWLSHNELELALDELEGLGEANECPRSFWEQLEAAADNMKLNSHVERYRERLKK